MTDDIVRAGNLATEVYEKAAMVYSKVIECKCIDFNATKSYEDIEVDRAIDNDSAVSITLQEVGILKKGTLLRHTPALGKRKSFKKKLMPDDMVTGQENLIDGTCEIVVMGGEKYKQLPPEYKQEGIVYIYDDGMTISAGDDFIYYLSKSFLRKVYTRAICIKGRPFKRPILAVLVPLDKKIEVKDIVTDTVNDTVVDTFIDTLDEKVREDKEMKKKNTKKEDRVVIIEKAKKVVKTPEDLALEVIAGKWGNGENRKKKLEKHGYNYDEVQRAVNDILTLTWERWEQSLKDTANDLKARGVQYRGDGSKAGNIDKYTDCSGYIQEALYNIHLFPKNEQFYLSKDLQGTKRGVECIEALFKVVHPKNKWKKASLHKGDIVGFNWGDGVHTMVYAGTGGKKGSEYPLWYSFGGSTPFSDKPVRKPFYEDKTVYVKLKPYNLNRQYRDK